MPYNSKQRAPRVGNGMENVVRAEEEKVRVGHMKRKGNEGKFVVV